MKKYQPADKITTTIAIGAVLGLTCLLVYCAFASLELNDQGEYVRKTCLEVSSCEEAQQEYGSGFIKDRNGDGFLCEERYNKTCKT